MNGLLRVQKYTELVLNMNGLLRVQLYKRASSGQWAQMVYSLLNVQL